MPNAAIEPSQTANAIVCSFVALLRRVPKGLVFEKGPFAAIDANNLKFLRIKDTVAMVMPTVKRRLGELKKC